MSLVVSIKSLILFLQSFEYPYEEINLKIFYKPKSTMILLTIYCLATVVSLTTSKEVSNVAKLVGSSVTISCHSSLPPTWHWSGSKEDREKTLALAGVHKHPNLKDPRFHFSESDSLYSLTLSKVTIADAGTFTCLGSSTVRTVLNVLG